MIRQLRKRHLQIWSVFALLIPAGIIIAWIAVPKKPLTNLFEPQETQLLPKIIRTKNTDHYTVNIRYAENFRNCQLEYINRSALNVPSLLIYIMKPEAQRIDEHQLLGRIESKGSHRFSLPADSGSKATGFILYDIIHRNILDTIIVEPYSPKEFQ